MPPTDDEYLAAARHAMMALEAQLYRSLGGPSPSRDQAQSIARQMRDIVARAIAALGVEGAEEIVDWYERAGKRVVGDLGTSAWNEPETVEQAKARMGTLSAAPGPSVLDRVNEGEPRPLTDVELAEIDKILGRIVPAELQGQADTQRYFAVRLRHAGLLLMAEVRRLRSDDWLVRAAEEITDSEVRDGYVEEAAVVAILRKHRDAKT